MQDVMLTVNTGNAITNQGIFLYTIQWHREYQPGGKAFRPGVSDNRHYIIEAEIEAGVNSEASAPIVAFGWGGSEKWRVAFEAAAWYCLRAMSKA